MQIRKSHLRPKSRSYLARSLQWGIPCFCLFLLVWQNLHLVHPAKSSFSVADFVLSDWSSPTETSTTADFAPRVVRFPAPLASANRLTERTLSPPPSWDYQRFLKHYDPDKFENFKTHQRQEEDDNYKKVHAKYYDNLKTKKLNGIPEHEQCELLDWQKTFYPICNSMHEYIDPYEIKEKGKGSQSVVFAFYDTDLSKNHHDDPKRLIWKTQMWKGDYVEGFYPEPLKRRQIEARVMERGTPSPFLLPLFGTCGTSTFVPYKTGESLSKVIGYRRRGKLKLTDTDLLNIAYQMAQGLADLHALNFVHLDLYESQWIQEDGIFQLNDFNFGKFMLTDRNTNATTCRDVTFPMEDAKYKSPEEIRSAIQTGERIHLDKGDVYGMGAVLYKVFTKQYMFNRIKDKKAYEILFKGGRSKIPDAKEATNGYVQEQETWTTLTTALDMCWEHDPDKRATAQEVADYLKAALWKRPEFRKLHPHTMNTRDLLNRMRLRIRVNH